MLPLLALVAALPAQAARQSSHPPVPLLDAAGTRVSESGLPLDTLRTCGTCHDQGFALSHSFHALFEPTDASSPGRRVAVDCFACHLDEPALEAVNRAYDSGRAEWANTAALAGTALVREEGDGWAWTDAVGEGRVYNSALPIVSADSRS